MRTWRKLKRCKERPIRDASQSREQNAFPFSRSYARGGMDCRMGLAEETRGLKIQQKDGGLAGIQQGNCAGCRGGILSQNRNEAKLIAADGARGGGFLNYVQCR
jgi:hypothetical protein